MQELHLKLIEFCELYPHSISHVTYQKGSLLPVSHEDTSGFFICTSGSVRSIDQQRTFGSLTLEILLSPVILGFSSFSEQFSVEILRANSEVCGYFIPRSVLPVELLDQLYKYWFHTLLSWEYPLVRQALSSTVFEDKLSSPLSHLSPENWPSLIRSDDQSSFTKVIYLDRPQLGFLYGHIYPFQLIKKVFSSESLARLLPIFPLETPSYQAQPTVERNFHRFQEDSDPKISDQPQVSLPLSIAINHSKLNTKSTCFTPSDYGITLINAFDFPSSILASLQMLLNHLNLPYQKDNIKRFISTLDLNATEPDSINNKILSLLDSLGLSVSLVRVPDSLPLRIPTPSLYITSTPSLALIVSASNSSINIIDPNIGPSYLTSTDTLEFFRPGTKLLRVAIGIHTPQHKFSYSWFLPYLSQYKLQLFEVVSASFLTQMFALATPLLFQQLIDRVVSKGAADSLLPLISLMLIFLFFEIAFSSLRTFQFADISNRIDIGIGSTIISRLLRLNGRFFDRRPVGELASRLQEIDNIRRFLTGTALTAVLDACFALIYFIVMFFYSQLLSFIVLLSVPILVLSTVGLTPITQRLIRQRAEASSRTQSFLVEMISGIQTIKLQSAELLAKRQWEQRHLRAIDLGFKAIMANTTSNSLVQFFSKFSNILVIGIGSWLVLENQLTIGELIAFKLISGNVTQPLLRLASIWQNFQELSLSFDRVADIVNQPLESGDLTEALLSLPPLLGSIEFSQVSYSYSSTSPDSLSGVSLKIPIGSFVGLVGQSGCGKSTLLKLVPRFYTPTTGRILIDGIDISKVDLYSLRCQLGYVPQDCMLFEGTVYSNILMGNPDASTEDVISVAKLACAHDFIMDLTQGYNTRIGERGAGVSGGQRQRISLARMFLSKPRLIILDEATSALDADTERQVVQNIRQYFANETVLMITHRLATLQRADMIIVMHSGVVDSIGTHDNLMEAKGRYFALYQSQFAE